MRLALEESRATKTSGMETHNLTMLIIYMYIYIIYLPRQRNCCLRHIDMYLLIRMPILFIPIKVLVYRE